LVRDEEHQLDFRSDPSDESWGAECVERNDDEHRQHHDHHHSRHRCGTGRARCAEEGPIFLASIAGLRGGEILGAVWANVDEQNGTMRIDRALSETKEKGVFFKKPKGKRTRTVALPPLLIEVRKAHREEQEKQREVLGTAYHDNDLICCRPDGSIWPPSAFTSSYRALLSRRKLTGPNFHALRHSHASQSLRDGVDIKRLLKAWAQQGVLHARAVLPPDARPGLGSRRAHR
jgi:integrase